MISFVKRQVPENELRFVFARSSGAGGQNVNKTSTKAAVYWPVLKSRAFTVLEKERIQNKLANRLTIHNEIMVVSEEERSQLRNRELAIARLNDLVGKSLWIVKKRRSTRPTLASKLKRLESKKKRSTIKKLRRVEED
ncbi:MAG TPA: alternative ribosome rescue aminoacyl-tRNA hydrolase ArfB [Patescibacteria group bacterium]|nr:alternative ribosome rescue aminoacyl-tRNA hydrolase ArfB [Patescibacteria group bacterium]